MRTLIVIVVVIGLIVAAPVAAEAREYEVSGGTAMHLFRSPSLDAAAPEDMVAMGDLGVAVQLTPYAPILGSVWVEGRWLIGSTEALDFNLYEAHLDLSSLQLGLRGQREVYPRLRAYAHADVGLTWGTLTVTDPFGLGGAGLADEQRAWAWSTGLGVDATLLQGKAGDPDPDLAMALRLELGWAATGDLSFVGRPAGVDPDAATIDTVAAPLGTVDADGMVIRIGIVGRF